MRNEDIFELIANGSIRVEYMENKDGEPLLGFEYSSAELQESIDQDAITKYVSECLMVASLAGFEAPTEYYRFIKSFVEDKSMDELLKTMEEDFLNLIDGEKYD